jgi:putative membrane-bound dehydrogenase-like protein
MNPHQDGYGHRALRLSCIVFFSTQLIGLGATQQIGIHEFTLPDGFVIEQVAGSPLVDRPIVADYDDQGRLYVADSSGSNDKVQQQLEDKPHRIVRLEDTDGDGVFDQSVVFAEGLMFPEGVLYHDGAIYCGAPPEIWKLEDTDGDGVCDRREVWFDAKTLTGCANDIHGPYLGKDGWIYWAKGAFAEQTHTLFNGQTIRDSAAHIFRCLPDLSEFDSVMSGGMDNPIEVVFDDAGEVFFTTTFYAHPRGGKRDALVHALYGGVYPKEHGVLDGLTLTGAYLPAMTHLGPAAPSGLARYESAAFGDDFHGNLFSTQFNLRKVQRHQLIPDGATFRTLDSDFVVSSHHDFHPTDVLEAGDGSLLVVDTGGWYKLCCPTSQLYKPDVLGAIYRVRKVGLPAVADPFGNDMEWRSIHVFQLIALLDDPRPQVRERAIQALVKIGEAAVAPLSTTLLSEQSTLVAKQHAIWSLTRMDSKNARAAVRNMLSEPEPRLVRAALHSVNVRRDKEAVGDLLTLIGHQDPHIARKAVEAIGRIGESQLSDALLSRVHHVYDRSHEHALVFALIQSGAHPNSLKKVMHEEENEALRRVALLALSQIAGEQLAAGEVAELFGSESDILKETALWVAGFHPEWGGELADHFARQLQHASSDAERISELASQVNLFVSNPSVQQRLAALLVDSDISLDVKEAVLKIMQSGNLRQVPASWVKSAANVLVNESSELKQLAVETLNHWPLNDSHAATLIPVITAIDAKQPESGAYRLQVLGILSQLQKELNDEQIAHLTSQFRKSDDNALRDQVVDTLRACRLSTTQLRSVLPVFDQSGPLQLASLVELFHGAALSELGMSLMDRLDTAPAKSSVRPDLLLYAIESFPDEVKARARAWLQSMEIDLDGQRAKLDALAASLPPGDVRRGQAVFKHESTACSACHQVGYVGGQVGPDLTRIGSVRTERDLLEAIVFPSASFVRSYEPMMVETKDGELYSGVMHLMADDQIRMVTGAHSEVILNQEDIESMRPGQVSIMPAGLDEVLSPQELSDLMAFLKSRK